MAERRYLLRLTGESLRLVLAPDRVRFHLRSPDGEPLSGEALVYKQFTTPADARVSWPAGVWIPDGRATGERLPIVAGTVTMARDRRPREFLEIARLAIEVPGHRPLHVSPLEIHHALVEPTYWLERIDDGYRSLRLSSPGGQPMQFWLEIQEVQPPQPLWSGRTRASGIAGPFFWPGEDLLVALDAGLPGRDIPLARIDAASFGDADLLDVEIPTATAEIEIIGVPDEIDAAGLLAEGRVQRATPCSREDGSVLFSGLLPGGYIVGPRELVEQEFHRSEYRGFEWPLSVAEGERATVRWDERWSASRPVTTRVEILAPRGAPRPFLMPVYVDPRLPVVGVHGRVPLGPNGAVVAAPGRPLPRGYFIAIPNEGGEPLHFVVGSVHAGEALTVELGGFVLDVVPDAQYLELSVSFEVPSEAGGPMSPAFANRFTRAWDARHGPLELLCVPVSVRALTVSSRSGSTTIAVDPVPGVVQRLRVKP